jgi:hypothetical protein
MPVITRIIESFSREVLIGIGNFGPGRSKVVDGPRAIKGDTLHG